MAAIFSCLLYLGKPERARDWARRAVLIDPDNMIMRYNLACDLVIQLRDFDMALKCSSRSALRRGGSNWSG